MSYVLVGLAPAEPERVAGPTPEPLHYTLDVDVNEVNPIAYAGDQRTLLEGGGTALWGGDHGTFHGTELWVRSAKSSGRPRVSIEQTTSPRQVSRDLFGVLQATTGAKALNDPAGAEEQEVVGRLLTPGQWTTISGGIVGCFAMKIRATGGDCYVGTHIISRKPDGTWYRPEDLPLAAGGPWKLGEAWEWVLGNPHLVAWTDDQDVIFEAVKCLRGRSFA